MRRLLRVGSTLVMLAGLGTLGWAVLTWQWEDPFTGVYTRLEQRELSRSYEQRAAEFKQAPKRGQISFNPDRVSQNARRYRQSSRPGTAIGRIKIPRLGLSMIVVNGTDEQTLKRGPGRYLGSFMPGEGQLVYVAGHRTTYSAPFSGIDALRPGDRVTLEMPYAVFEYRITKSVIVGARDLAVLRSPGREVLALQTCHPRFFATHRYIAYAEPIRVARPKRRTIREATRSGLPAPGLS